MGSYPEIEQKVLIPMRHRDGSASSLANIVAEKAICNPQSEARQGRGSATRCVAPGARQPEKGRDDFGSQTCNLEVLGVEDLHQIARNRAVKPRSLERAGADVSGTEGGGVAVGEAGDAGTEKQGGGDGNDLQKFLHDVSSLKGMERPCYSARETGLNVREGPLVLFPESVKFVVLKSALEDFEGSTLSAVPGLLGKLRYLARLYTRGVYSHWGMEKVYGSGAA